MSPRSWRLGCCVLLGLAVGLRAAELHGVVLENLSGRPLARARVTLQVLQGEGAPEGTALTDSAGRFQFRALPRGAYLLSAARVGYLTGRFGQRRWNGAGTPVVLDADAQFFAEIRLRRLGVITGQVLDENHIGMPGLAVYAFRADQRPLRMVAAGLTDDRGVYRIPGLEPGPYYVRTGPRLLEDGRGLLPTYYGGTVNLAEARAVEVQLDRETAQVDIEPLAGRLTRLAGRVLGGTAHVSLYSETGQREVQTGPDGSFQFEELAPGPYHLIALTHSTPPRAAWRRLYLSGAASELSVELLPLPSLRVACESLSGAAVDCRRVQVFLRREEPPATSLVRVDGGQVETLPPGGYELAVGWPPEYYVHSLRPSRGAGAPGRLEAMPGEKLELTVVLGTRPAGLSGKVVDAEDRPVPGAPVFLTAADAYWRRLLGGNRTVRADQRGEFRFDGLPPGRYRLFSSFEIAEPTEADWDAVNAAPVTVEEGSRERLELKLTGGL